MTIVSSLFIYPIKSCQGLALSVMPFDVRGPEGDRRYMVVDDEGRFLTQRENPRLSLIAPRFAGAALSVSAPGVKTLELPQLATSRRRVQVWKFEAEAEDMGDDCARWFSGVLSQNCRLVRFADDVKRTVSKNHTALDAEVAFADAYPVLLLSLWDPLESTCRHASLSIL